MMLYCAVGCVTMTSISKCVLPMSASMSGRCFEKGSRSRGSTFAVPPTLRIARARVCTIESCRWMMAPPLMDLHVRKWVPVEACLPHMHCTLLDELLRFMPSRKRFDMRQALSLRRLTPSGDGISHCVAFGAAQDVMRAIVDVFTPEICLVN